jgi:hypothetical protein
MSTVTHITMDEAHTFAQGLIADGWLNSDPNCVDTLHRQLVATLADRLEGSIFPVRGVNIRQWLSSGICTCPSGDGSLRWPCPSHLPLVIPIDQVFQVSPSACDVIAERRRQIEQKDYLPEHDDEHACGELGAYAAFFAMPDATRDWPATETGYGDTFGQAIVPADWARPKTGDRRRELVKAGALILAEIDRMDRADKTGGPA